MELTVLGCGDAFGSAGRYHTSFLFTEGEEHVMLDCGTTTLLRLKYEKISLHQVSTIIITHFHGDHYGGLPFLLICALFEYPRTAPLTIVGPKNIKERVYALQEAMYPGTSEKLNELHLCFHEFTAGEDLIVDDKVIKAYEVKHSPQSNPHGIRLHWKSKVIAFSGDTSWTDKLIELSEGAHVFLCECNFMNGEHFGHLSYEELVEKRALFHCDQFWITHMSEEVLNAGETAFAQLHDGLKINF